ncbi:hypothetical protein Tco_0321482 [Tanacetum coccineum]
MKVEESLNVKCDETPLPNSPPLVDDDLLEFNILENQSKDLEVKENEPSNKQISNIKESKDHPLGTVIGNINQRTLRSQIVFIGGGAGRIHDDYFLYRRHVEDTKVNMVSLLGWMRVVTSRNAVNMVSFARLDEGRHLKKRPPTEINGCKIV